MGIDQAVERIGSVEEDGVVLVCRAAAFAAGVLKQVRMRLDLDEPFINYLVRVAVILAENGYGARVVALSYLCGITVVPIPEEVFGAEICGLAAESRRGEVPFEFERNRQLKMEAAPTYGWELAGIEKAKLIEELGRARVNPFHWCDDQTEELVRVDARISKAHELFRLLGTGRGSIDLIFEQAHSDALMALSRAGGRLRVDGSLE